MIDNMICPVCGSTFCSCNIKVKKHVIGEPDAIIFDCPICKSEIDDLNTLPLNSIISDKQWEGFGYDTNQPCDVCGATGDNKSEPRFGYVVCRKHTHIPPVLVSKISRRRG